MSEGTFEDKRTNQTNLAFPALYTHDESDNFLITESDSAIALYQDESVVNECAWGSGWAWTELFWLAWDRLPQPPTFCFGCRLSRLKPHLQRYVLPSFGLFTGRLFIWYKFLHGRPFDRAQLVRF